MQLLRKGMLSDRLSDFYADESLKDAHLLSYMEVLEIFGTKVDYEYLPEVNKKLIQSHFLMQNAVHDQMRKYQFVPLLLRVLYLTSSSRSNRILKSALLLPASALGPGRLLRVLARGDLQLRQTQTLPLGQLL